MLEQEARIAGFKSEVQKSQELHHSSLTRDTERLQTMLDKVKAEIRWVALCLYVSYTCAATALFAVDLQKCCCAVCLVALTYFGEGQTPPWPYSECVCTKCCMWLQV